MLFPELHTYCLGLSKAGATLPEDRKQVLEALAQHVAKQWGNQGKAEVLFVCTHNSRRSVLAQVWLAIAAYWHEVKHVIPYSGGTEATGIPTQIVEALERAGCMILQRTEAPNPQFAVEAGSGVATQLLFSKHYTDQANPERDFTAVMVCGEADAACPFVPGALARVALPFEDPKLADGTKREAAAYDQACERIGQELFYMMEQVKRFLPA